MPKQIPALTGLRFFAAFTVVLAHGTLSMAQFDNSPSAIFALRNFSSLGMTLFFVLSGFVIHYSYRTSLHQPYGFYNFIVARFARLYPLYFVLIAVELLLVYRTYVGLGIGYKLGTLGFYVTLTQTWTYGLF